MRDSAMAQLSAIMAKKKPSYSSGGESTDWDGHVAQLRETIDWANEQIDRVTQNEQGYYSGEEIIIPV